MITTSEFLNVKFAHAQTDNLNSTSHPNINATNIHDSKTMVLGNDIKHLVILIPNEAHESPAMEEEQRHINQPYIPQKAVVRPGTMITWFNGDVDHDHKITLNDASSKQEVFDSGVFAFNEASKPIIVNNISTFNYFEANVNNEDEDFVMDGEIIVVDQPSSSTIPNSSSSSNNNIDTVGTYMVPTQDIDTYLSELTDRGFVINSMYDFQDLRGGQEGTGDKQTLIVWGANSSAMPLDTIINSLKEITPELPYILSWYLFNRLFYHSKIVQSY
jgi:plastocyanin